jgi:Aldo/keto reductase family
MFRELRIPVMAYSPIEQGRIIGSPVLRDIAIRHNASPMQIALAWVLRRGDICAIPDCAIPRSSSPEHTSENRAALEVTLDHDDLVALDAEFPPPLYAQPWRCSSGSRPHEQPGFRRCRRVPPLPQRCRGHDAVVVANGVSTADAAAVAAATPCQVTFRAHAEPEQVEP